MRTRIKSKVNIESVIEQIDTEIKSYSRAVKVVMKLHEVAYKDAKQILERQITERLIFKRAA
jgi:hypothetical protein